jgi:hypothetical protein
MAFIEIEGIGKIEVPEGLSEDQQNQIAQKVVQDYSEAKSAVSPGGIGDYAARQAGLTARAAMTPTTLGALTGAGIGAMVGGVGAAPGAVAGATAGFLTDIGSRVYSSLTGRGKPLNELLEEIKTDIGLPRPATPTERFAQQAVETTTGLIGPMGAGKLAMQSVSPVAQRVGQVLTERPAMQAISGLAGATGASFAEESGAGPIGQTVAGLAGALAPSVAPISGAALRAAGRAGATQEEIRRNIEAFAQAGTTPSAGQATGKTLVQGMESSLGRIPGAIGVMREKAMTQQAEVGQRVKEVAEKLSKVKEPTVAGAGIQRGVEDIFVPRSRAIESGLYNKLDEYIPKFKPVKAKNTYAALEKLSRPIEGAPALSRNQLISNEEITLLKNDLESDLLNAEGDIPFSALKELRSRIGQKMSSVNLASNVQQATYKKIYGAISDDLREAARESGADALTALSRANKYTKSFHERIDKLQGFINKNEPEKIYRAAFEGTELGATRLRAVMQSLPKPEQKAVASSFISKMGKALPGQQDELGDVFSTERFLTNWNKLSPEAKQVLFNRFGSDYRKNLDKIAETASMIREGSRVLANPSGTAAAGVQPATLAVLATAVAAGQYKLLTGLLTASALSRASAKAFTNPKYVNWLAENSNIPTSAIPGAISTLSNIAKEDNDQDLAEIAEQLKRQEISKKIGK